MRASYREIIINFRKSLAMNQPKRATAVRQRRASVEHLNHLGHGDIADPQKPSHVGLAPDQLTSGSRAQHHIEFVGVTEQLEPVPSYKSSVWFCQYDKIAYRLCHA